MKPRDSLHRRRHLSGNSGKRIQRIAGAKLDRVANLTVVNLPFAATQALAKLARRNMRLHCTMQDGQMWVADSERSVAIEPQLLKGPPAAG